jgi:hypothetical protein
MAQNKTLNKIQNFVKEKIDSSQGSVVITTIANGFKVNNLRIQQKDASWLVNDASGAEIGNFMNQRLSVLYAALVVKKKFMISHCVSNYDVTLSTLKHDKTLFESKIARQVKPELFEDRYSRTIFELSQLYEQILELEKSVGLQ